MSIAELVFHKLSFDNDSDRLVNFYSSACDTLILIEMSIRRGVRKRYDWYQSCWNINGNDVIHDDTIKSIQKGF